MEILNWFAFGLVLLAASGIILRRNWRWTIGLLALQFLGLFWLVHASWNISFSSVKLVTGWMMCAILGFSHLNHPLAQTENEPRDPSWPQGRLFRLSAIGLVLTVTYAGGIGLGNWLEIPLYASWGGLLLIGLGLLHTGITSDPIRVIVGLLTALGGFEIIYAAVESSALVAGLLVLINLGLALTGAYFLNLQEETATS